MIVGLGAPRIETSIAGDEVSQRVLRLRSQPEQIWYLRQMVNEWSGVYAIRARARDIVFRQYGCPPKNKVCHALAIGEWVQNTITYVEEKPEVFQTPTSTIAQGYGDCDDFTSLIGALGESIGLDVDLVGLEWWERGSGREFRHIFPRAVVDGFVVPLDATLNAPIRYRTDPIAAALAKHPDLRVCVG